MVYTMVPRALEQYSIPSTYQFARESRMIIADDTSLSETQSLPSHGSGEGEHPSIRRALDEILSNEADGLMFSSHVSHSSAVE